MSKLRIIVAIALSCFWNLSTPLTAKDHLLEILKGELKREVEQFNASGETAPYFIAYRVDDCLVSSSKASFGSLYSTQYALKFRTFTPMVRIGSYHMDNFRESKSNMWLGGNFIGGMLPIEDETGDATRMAIWSLTNSAYRKGIQQIESVKSDEKTKVESEDKSDDYSKEAPITNYEEKLKASEINFDTTEWQKRIKEYSAILKEYPEIMTGNAYYEFNLNRKYYVNSEGTEVVQNERYARVMVEGAVIADDGMKLPLYLSYFAFDPKDITPHETILADVRRMAETLVKLRTAPTVESFTGPALLSPEASGVFFHEIFGHRIEGQRLKSERDGQTFKKKIGELVLPQSMSVVMDPTMKKFNNYDLNGYFKYDDEGVKGERVEVVTDGILKGFLMSRTPIDGFPNSNGHGRAASGNTPVTRQSNLILQTTNPKTHEELRQILIEEAKMQGREYGYYFGQVTGGSTTTARFSANAFNVNPLEVYRIFVDGRPDELVRGVTLIGTPLAMFGQITEAGDKSGIFTGICGAESGGVPVTCISPELFVRVIETQKAQKSNEKLPILPRPTISK